MKYFGLSISYVNAKDKPVHDNVSDVFNLKK